MGGYAAFDNGKLARAVLINSNAWFTTSTGARPSVTLALSTLNTESSGAIPKKVQVRRLTIGFADDTAGVTFGGRTYETSDGLPSGKDACDVVEVQGGTFEVVVSSTEAVHLTFEY